jgi:hypothetical protein
MMLKKVIYTQSTTSWANLKVKILIDLTKKLLRIVGHPDEWVIRHPIWTTWAKYKKDITDDIVVGFAQDIADHGFTGQIEIDEFWEVRATKNNFMIIILKNF